MCPMDGPLPLYQRMQLPRPDSTSHPSMAQSGTCDHSLPIKIVYGVHPISHICKPCKNCHVSRHNILVSSYFLHPKVNEALKIQPNYAKALLRRAASNGKLDRWAESVRDYEILSKELPGDTEVAEALFHAQVALKISQGEEVSNLKFGGAVEEIAGLEQFRLAISSSGNGSGTKPVENVILIHGLLSSSSMWMETVIPDVSEAARPNLRMFALDLLGFGKSPKPTDCMYTLKDHLQMIEDSIIAPYQLSSFHLVAHSMGCIMALALAAKYPDSVKSVTIVAPPYFSPSSDKNASHTALNRLAERKVWPPLLFGASVMSWYEHLCRTVCYVVCRNHLKWDWIPKLLANKSDTCNFMKGLHEHTHRSAFRTMHNVLCAGAKLLDGFLEVVSRSGTPLTIIQGDRDTVVPPDCSYNVKLKVPHARLQVIGGADHRSVISDRKKIFAEELEDIWLSSSKCNRARQIRCQLDA